MGLTPEQIADCCRQIEGYVLPVNFNSPAQTVIAGDPAAVEAACARCAEAGASRTVPLKVSGAFHTRYMEPASDALYAELEGFAFADPALPVYACLLYTSVIPLPVHQKLHRAGPPVPRLFGHRHGGGAHLGALFRGQQGGGGLLHQLLVAALDRALPLEEVHRVAERIGQDLKLDVPGVGHELLDVDPSVAKAGGGLGGGLHKEMCIRDR